MGWLNVLHFLLNWTTVLAHGSAITANEIADIESDTGDLCKTHMTNTQHNTTVNGT